MKKRKEKQTEKRHCRRQDLNPWTLSPEPSALTARLRRPVLTIAFLLSATKGQRLHWQADSNNNRPELFDDVFRSFDGSTLDDAFEVDASIEGVVENWACEAKKLGCFVSIAGFIQNPSKDNVKFRFALNLPFTTQSMFDCYVVLRCWWTYHYDFFGKNIYFVWLEK